MARNSDSRSLREKRASTNNPEESAKGEVRLGMNDPGKVDAANGGVTWENAGRNRHYEDGGGTPDARVPSGRRGGSLARKAHADVRVSVRQAPDVSTPDRARARLL